MNPWPSKHLLKVKESPSYSNMCNEVRLMNSIVCLNVVVGICVNFKWFAQMYVEIIVIHFWFMLYLSVLV